MNDRAEFGKWSQRDIPHKGWKCVDIADLGEPSATCEMCESAEIRYVHFMTHPDYEDLLAVGCVCAGRMEEDYVGAKERETEFKRRQNPEVSAALSWVKAADEILAKGGLNLREYEFITSMRARAEHDASPRVRKRYYFSPKQISWFRSIYLRVVRGERKSA